jgi:hypothetical protein
MFFPEKFLETNFVIQFEILVSHGIFNRYFFDEKGFGENFDFDFKSTEFIAKFTGFPLTQMT